jgi:hypothetical protein
MSGSSSRAKCNISTEQKEALDGRNSSSIRDPITPNMHLRSILRHRTSLGDSSIGTENSKSWLAKRFSKRLSLYSLTGGSSFSVKDGNNHRTQGFWTRMANNSNVWSDEVDDEEGGQEGIKKSCASFRYEVQVLWKIAKDNPRIPAISAACLLILIAVSTVICVRFHYEYKWNLSELAQRIALNSAQQLHEELEQATLVPLHTLASFVPELIQFQNLPRSLSLFTEGHFLPGFYLHSTTN